MKTPAAPRVMTLPAAAAAVARLLAAVAVAALPLTACSPRIGRPEPTLFEADAARDAAQKLAAKIQGPGPAVRALSVEITPELLAIQVQDPAAPTHIDEYQLQQIRVTRRNPRTGNIVLRGGVWSWFSWEQVSGPRPVQFNLINPKLEENLFNLADINFAALPETIREAERRVALEGGGGVTRIRIQRSVHNLSTPRGGEVEWQLSLGNLRENAVAFADARGRLTRLNLDGTVRAKTMDLRDGGPLLDDVIAKVRAAFGEDARALRRLSVTRSYLSFNGRDPKNPGRTADYSCNLGGLSQSAFPRPVFPGQAAGDPDAEFWNVDEVDWSRLPALKAAALEQLAIPGGAVDAIRVDRPPTTGIAPKPVQWELTVKGAGAGGAAGEEGKVYFDGLSGAVVRRVLPPGRRPPVIPTDPDAIRQTLAALRENFGPRARYMNLMFTENTCIILAPGVRDPKKILQSSYREDQFSASTSDQTPFHKGFTDEWLFDLDELERNALPILADLKRKTLARLGFPADAKIERITFYRHTPFYRENKKLLIEIRPADGYMIFDSQGGVVQVTTP